MKYTPPDYMAVQEGNESLFHPEQIPVTETTKYMRWGTELEETPGNKEILVKHPIRRFQINKFMPMGNYPERWKHQKQIEHIRAMEIELLIEAELIEEAEEVALSTIQDSQFSRGDKGFFTKEQGRIRYDIKQEEIESKNEKRVGFFKTKQPKPVDHEVNWKR